MEAVFLCSATRLAPALPQIPEIKKPDRQNNHGQRRQYRKQHKRMHRDIRSQPLTLLVFRSFIELYWLEHKV